MYRKNVAGQNLPFVMINASTGAALTGATVTARRSIDGAAQASATGSVSELANGQYNFALSQADTNGNNIGILLTAASAIPVHFSLVTTAADPTDTVRFGLTAIPSATPGRTGGLPIVMQGGLAAASTSTTITLDATLTVDQIPSGASIAIVAGTGVGQVRQILDYIGSTKVATVDGGWATNPDTTSVYNIYGPRNQPRTVFQSGTAQAGAAATITLSALAGSVDNFYNGLKINTLAGTGAAQTRTIIGYVGATKVATVDHAWATNPSSTTLYAIVDDNGLATDGAGGLASIAATAVAQIWNALTSGMSTVGSIGKRIADNLDALITSRLAPTTAGRTLDVSTTGEAGLDFDNIKDATGAHTLTNIRVPNVTLADTVTTYTGNTPQTGDNFARLGAPAGASIAADIAGVQSDTDNLQTRLPAALSGGKMDSVISGGVTVTTNNDKTGYALSGAGVTAVQSGLSTVTTAQVNAEVLDVLNVDTFAEPASVPAATATLAAKIGFIMALARNKITQTATTQLLRNSADSATIATSTDADDGTTYTRGGFV